MMPLTSKKQSERQLLGHQRKAERVTVKLFRPNRIARGHESKDSLLGELELFCHNVHTAPEKRSSPAGCYAIMKQVHPGTRCAMRESKTSNPANSSGSGVKGAFYHRLECAAAYVVVAIIVHGRTGSGGC